MLVWGHSLEPIFLTKQDLKASVDALVKHLVTYLLNQKFWTPKCVITAFLLRKSENTAFLWPKNGKKGIFVAKNGNTRTSIAFKDMLRSSIAPQNVLHCFSMIFREELNISAVVDFFKRISWHSSRLWCGKMRGPVEQILW